MSGAPIPPTRALRAGAVRAAVAAVLATALAAGALSLAAPAQAEGEQEKAPSRFWRAVKRVPGQVGSAGKRAARGIGDAFERDEEKAEAAAPAPKPAPPRTGPGARPGSAPREARTADEPAPAPPPLPRRATRAAPRQVDARPGLTTARRAVLLGAFGVALAGVALSLARRRSAAPDRPQRPAGREPEAPPERSLERTMPLALAAEPLPPPTVSDGRPTVRVPPSGRPTVQHEGGFDPAALDRHAEAAVAAALAQDAERATPFPGGGRYELLAEIGRGGMGVVYQARDKRLDRIVALKRLPENLQAHPRAVELLLREARSAAQLNHPHIVTVYDVDHEDGAYFLTMEFLEGQPLSHLLHRRGRFAASEVAWLGRQAAAGLAYAHERRIIHRDVKTANLFLTRDRVVKIMDFGLAKMMEVVRRRSTRIGGTPDYMAPEQALGVDVDERADLYSLGVTFYEMLTGSVPFEEGDVARHHRETPPPDPRERAHELPDALAKLVLQMLAKEPGERPASAAEVAERLRAIEQATLRGDSA